MFVFRFDNVFPGARGDLHINCLDNQHKIDVFGSLETQTGIRHQEIACSSTNDGILLIISPVSVSKALNSVHLAPSINLPVFLPQLLVCVHPCLRLAQVREKADPHSFL